MRFLQSISRPASVAAILILIAFTLKDGLPLTKYIAAFKSPPHNQVSDFDNNLKSVRASYSFVHAFGYITDHDPIPPYSDYEANKRFVLTQYALAPAILVTNVTPQNPGWVIASFSDPDFDPVFRTDLSLVLRSEIGNGLRLYSNRLK